MSDGTTIEWTQATWNPVRGCTPVSAGCSRCYARTFAERWRGIPGHAYEQGFDVRLVPEALELPLRWRKPRRVFVNSMSDLFHDAVPDEFIAAVFGVMAASPHTFQIVTKRAARLPRWFAWLEMMAARAASVFDEDPVSWRRAHILRASGLRAGVHHKASAGDMEARGWPLPNVWLGVSVEDQAAADERIPHLLATPAAVRFLSCEPLLGPVRVDDVDDGEHGVLKPLVGLHWVPGHDGDGNPAMRLRGGRGPKIDWVIAGGESGPRSRPCDVAWIRSIVEQCRAAAAPCFVKQLGARSVVTPPQGECPTPGVRDRKGGDPAEWPADLRVRQMPEVTR